MSTLIDILGATVITGFLILMTISFSSRINDVTQESISSDITLNDASNSAQILEYYLYKIGSMATSDVISVADSNKIRFMGDIDEDGSAEDFTLYNYTGREWTETENPDDSPIYSRINSGDNNLIAVVTKFNLTYFDEMLSEISYADLASRQSARDSIRSVRVFVKSESRFPVDSVYQGVVWERLISPKNLIIN